MYISIKVLKINNNKFLPISADFIDSCPSKATN